MKLDRTIEERRYFERKTKETRYFEGEKQKELDIYTYKRRVGLVRILITQKPLDRF